MKAHIKLGRIFGIEIGLHLSWFIIALLITLSLADQFHAFNRKWGEGAIWATAIATSLLFFAAIIAHELSHAMVARARHLPVRSITLFALGGVAQIEREAGEASTEFFMGIAGPITSALIGAVCLAVAWVLGWTPFVMPQTPLLAMLMWLGARCLAQGKDCSFRLEEVEVKMRKRSLRMLVIVVMASSLSAPAVARSADALPGRTPQANRTHMINEVRHELRMLPYYGVFDWLEFEVRPDNTVVLRGQVVRPSTKSDAEARVRQIDGVSRVLNEIQVLPPSPADDRLRVALYRTLYNWDSPLFRYATQSVPPIHIIVDHGRATLKGIVDSRADAQLAYMRARGVPGLFDVKNELQVESEMPK